MQATVEMLITIVPWGGGYKCENQITLGGGRGKISEFFRFFSSFWWGGGGTELICFLLLGVGGGGGVNDKGGSLRGGYITKG